MSERDFLAEQFEQHRPHLRRVAYRMLGTLDESDDAVQEAWLRLSRVDDDEIQNLGGWLTTVVARVSLDMLRAAAGAPRGVDRRLASRSDRQRRSGVGSRAGGAPGRLGRARAARRARDADAGRAARVRPPRHVRRPVRRDRRDHRPQPRRDPPARKQGPPPGSRLAPDAVDRPRRAPAGDRRLPRRVARGGLRGTRRRARPRRRPPHRPCAAPRSAGRAPRSAGGRLERDAVCRARAARAAGARQRDPGFYVAPEGKLFAVGSFVVAEGRITEIDIVADPEKLARIEVG